jgi:poly(hydroxyalkanoate) granule-associated protein
MEVQLNVRNIDLRDAQEQVDNNLRQLREVSRKAILAYAGLWGLAYDEAVSVLEKGKTMLERAEDRGESLETAANRQVHKVREEAQSRLKSVEARVESFQDKIVNRAQRAEDKVEYDMEAQIERVLERLGIPSRERINRLSVEIEALSQKIDAQLAVKEPVVVAVTPEPVALPVVNYDTFTAKEVIALLEGLTIAELIEIKRYEEEHEKRVTVLREVARRLEAMPIAGYDEMTVETIETKLESLDDEQLAYLFAYEEAHENRVTLLRSIQQKQEARRSVPA